MNTIVENKLDKNSKLYNAFSNIPAEKFAEFYAQIVPEGTGEIENIVNLNVIIEQLNLFSGPELNVKFRLQLKQDNLKDLSTLAFIGRIFRQTKSSRLFSLFGYVDSWPKQEETNYTEMWREFLTENLGRELYRTLLAEYVKKSIDKKIAANNNEHANLIAKLVENKLARKALSEEMKQFQEEYADVLNPETAATSETVEENVEEEISGLNEETKTGTIDE